MTSPVAGEDIAATARTLVGTPFRLHGRDPAFGLDCIGVVEAAFTRAGIRCRLPNGYRLRALDAPDIEPVTRAIGLRPAEGTMQPGDVLMLSPSAYQLHLVLAVSSTMAVHAHAGLRKVVLGPLPDQWPRRGHWRFSPSTRN